MQVISMAPIFGRLISQSPVYLVWLGGAVLALVRWRQHPRVSLLAVIGLGVLSVNSLVSTVLNSALPLMVASRGLRGSFPRAANALGVCNILLAVIAAIGYGLVLTAVFSGRAPQPAVDKES